MKEENAMTYRQAEELFDELLRTGASKALEAIRKAACAHQISPIQTLVAGGDPREETKH